MADYQLQHLTDDDLMTGLRRLARDHYERLAELMAHLAEVDRRQLYLAHAASSLFSYCREVLNFSEGESYKRIQAARAARRFPVIFGMVAAGELHLSAICVLAPILTEDNHRALLTAARRCSKEEVKALVAAHYPRPDVATSLRRVSEPAAALALPSRTAAAAMPTDPASTRAKAAVAQPVPTREQRPGASSSVPATQVEWAPLRPDPRPALEPLSAERYRLTVTISGRAREQLRSAQMLLGHERPGCDLAEVLELALGELVERLEQRRFAKKRGRGAAARGRVPAAGLSVPTPEPVAVKPSEPTPEPVAAKPCEPTPDPAAGSQPTPETVAANQSKPPPAGRPGPTASPWQRSRSRHIPAALRRAVAERDGYCCTFREPGGRRCGSRFRLEYHHLDAFARSGEHSLDNLTLRCRPHNAYQARLDFGDTRPPTWTHRARDA